MSKYRTKDEPLVLKNLPARVEYDLTLGVDGAPVTHRLAAFPSATSILSWSIRKQIGYYEDVVPDYDPATHQLGTDPVWDEEVGTVMMGVVEIPAQTVFATSQARLTDVIQSYLDITARTRYYDGILSLCSYATSTDPIFAAEGQAGVIFRDACWRSGYEVMTAVLAGARSIPTEAELLAEMPAIAW